ncbi:MAG: type II secretion system F family protein [Candidatus Omnitrophota bacterium]|nr:type II secretion system F family protein [Candidatus Omnitrophota bacterium]
MPIFAYKAIDKSGKEIGAKFEAAGYDQAIKKLRGMELFPVKVTLVKEKKTAADKTVKGAPVKTGLQMELRIPFLGIGTVKSGQISLFTRQLATLIGAGLPLVRSLNILRDQMKYNTFRNVIGSIAQQVEAGSTFSDSLLKYPKIFSKLFVNTIKAGETGGVLEVVLTRLAEFNEKSEKLRKKIVGALVYPAIVILVAILVVVFIIIFVIPQFMNLFEELGTELPIPTMILLNLSDFMQNRWPIGVLFIAFAGIGYKLLTRFSAIRYVIDMLKIRFPVCGALVQKVSIARFSRTLGTLISSGVPILQALTITKNTTGNEVIARSLAKVHDSIREGESIAGPLSKARFFPLMVVNMINVGEETGSLDQMLHKIADTYDDDVDTTVNALTSLLEPMLIVFMGAIVGAIVIAMFLPLIRLLTTLGM